MKTTKLRAGIAILSLSALALTGCGNGGNGPNDPAPNNGQNSQQPGNNGEQPQPQPQGQAKPFSEIKDDVQQQLTDISSYKLQAEITTSTGTMQLTSSQTVKPSIAADMQMKMDIAEKGQKINGGFHIMLVGDQMYMKFDDQILDSMMAEMGSAPPEMRQRFEGMRGKFMNMPMSASGQNAPTPQDFTEFTDGLDFSQFGEQGEPAQINGQNAFKYSGTKDGAETSIFVDAADGKTVIAIEGNVSDLVSDGQVNVGNQSATGQKAQDAKGRARISNINEQFNIQAPSQDQIVDMKELMGSPNGSNF